MSKISSTHHFLCFLVLQGILFFASCKDEATCGSENDSNLKMEFLSKKGEITQDSTIRFDSVFALGNDSIFYQNLDTSKLALPVNIFDDVTTFVLLNRSLADTTVQFADTLTVGYQKNQKLISEDCGPDQSYDSLKVLQNPYDSLILKNDQLNFENNLSIYL